MVYTVFETYLGWMGVIASESGIRRLTIPLNSPDEVLTNLHYEVGQSDLDPLYFKGFVKRIQQLFDGELVDFPDPLDLPEAPSFTKTVRQATCNIPRGQTRSYGEVAAIAGNPRAGRAVGQVMASNPVAILIPCHRVIASDGGLGGYGGHINMKKRLLAIEGALDSDGLYN